MEDVAHLGHHQFLFATNATTTDAIFLRTYDRGTTGASPSTNNSTAPSTSKTTMRKLRAAATGLKFVTLASSTPLVVTGIGNFFSGCNVASMSIRGRTS